MLFLGRFDEPRKGMAVLLGALPALVERFPDIEILVVGRGDEDELREEAGELAGHLRFLGQVDDATKASAMRSADVYCAPNTGGESFGIVLVEAMAAGTAVVASDLDAFRRVLLDGKAGRLVPVDDSDALAAALIDVLADDDAARAATSRPRRRRCAATTGRWWPTRSCGSTRPSPGRAPRCRWRVGGQERSDSGDEPWIERGRRTGR